MAVAKPRNLAEKAAVERELKRKYPQMQTAAYKERVAKARKAAKKGKKTKRTEEAESRLKAAGLSDSDLAKFR